MRNSPQKITQALHLYFSGVSLRKTQEHLGVFHSHNASHVSVLKWIRKYSEMVGNFTDSVKLKVGEELMGDEMEYKVKGKQAWFVDIIDTHTRYLVASDFMKHRTITNLSEVFSKAKNRTGNQVKTVTTDGLKGYPKVMRKSFMLRKNSNKITHKVVTASEGGFNHKVERLHNSIRERTKVFRGFGNLESARLIMKGYEIYYNFCRKHKPSTNTPMKEQHNSN